MRMIFHNMPANISVGANVAENGEVHVAFAAVHPNDLKKSSRKWANKILNDRLEGQNRFFMGTYTGDTIGGHVFGPIRDAIRNLSSRRNVSGLPETALANLQTASDDWESYLAKKSIDKLVCCRRGSCSS